MLNTLAETYNRAMRIRIAHWNSAQQTRIQIESFARSHFVTNKFDFTFCFRCSNSCSICASKRRRTSCRRVSMSLRLIKCVSTPLTSPIHSTFYSSLNFRLIFIFWFLSCSIISVGSWASINSSSEATTSSSSASTTSIDKSRVTYRVLVREPPLDALGDSLVNSHLWVNKQNNFCLRFY